MLAAGTEIVCGLGLEEQLIGRFVIADLSKEDVLNLLKTLKPDVVLVPTNIQNTFTSFNNVKEALEDLLNHPVKIILLETEKLDAVFTDIKTVSEVLGVPDRGADLVERMQERLDLIKHKLKFITQKPTVACIERLEPLMTAENWTVELVETAGGQAVLAKNGKPSSTIDWMDLVNADPEIIIVMPGSFNIERTLKEMDVLLQLPYFQDLQAVKNNRFFIVDGSLYFNHSGLQIVDAVEILAEIINPKQFIFGYEGEGWIKFSL